MRQNFKQGDFRHHYLKFREDRIIHKKSDLRQNQQIKKKIVDKLPHSNERSE